ncbi:hypothetical protein ACIGG6_02035 [Vreelandella lionensis]|uniref:Uncharacterized protein n=1 Tax=Vreelandella lionensis TaxID=1144478 RepID=A0ABW8BNH9_9GAMM
MLGLIGGALAGGAEAAQDNARTRINQMHDDAILRMRQEFASSERQASQEFSREERVAGQEFTSGENQANRQHDMGLLQMREAGANRRSAAQIAASREQRPQWQMVPDGNGGYIQYDPVTNNYREANLPEGVSFGGSELTERERLTIETLADERTSIMESSMGQPSDQQAARLGEINAQMERLLGTSAGGGDLATRLTEQLGIDPDAVPEEQAAPPESAPPRSAPPPRPNTAEGYMGARQEADSAQQADQEADDAVQELAAEARRIAGRITIPDQLGGGFQRGGLINSATQGGIDTEAEREAAQVVLERVSAAYNQESDPQRKAMLKRALDALYEAGVTR